MYNVKVFIFSPIQENTYVLTNNKKEAIIIDPGCYGKQEEQQLEDYIVSGGLEVRLLLNTHCHLDHVFGNKFVAEKWALKPKIHKFEKQVLDYAPVAGLMWNLPFDNYTGEVDYLEEGDETGLEGDPLKVLFTPGHSPGSISFYSQQQGFVISGDVLFQGSVGRTDLPMGDFNTLSASIRNKIYTLPDGTVVYSGHGSPTKVGVEKRTNPFVQLTD
jgi:glyoxylase-like metal-dependent hydrolase (beta-lactamase superfamily II)